MMQCHMMPYDTIWCHMMPYDAIWCHMMMPYDAIMIEIDGLCQKVISEMLRKSRRTRNYWLKLIGMLSAFAIIKTASRRPNWVGSTQILRFMAQNLIIILANQNTIAVVISFACIVVAIPSWHGYRMLPPNILEEIMQNLLPNIRAIGELDTRTQIYKQNRKSWEESILF